MQKRAVAKDPTPKAPKWAGRVPRRKIAALYEQNAAGIWNEELIDDVGTSLLLRCRDSLRVLEAHQGHAPCPVCDARVPHAWDKQSALVCAECGWRGRWGDYLASYQDKQLVPGGMEGYFREFLRDYPRARAPQEKMLLIDLLIHRFHREYSGQAVTERNAGRAGGVNLIGGRLTQVMQFLDGLTYGERTAPELRETKLRWRSYVQEAQAAAESNLRDKKARRSGKSLGPPEGDG